MRQPPDDLNEGDDLPTPAPAPSADAAARLQALTGDLGGGLAGWGDAPGATAGTDPGDPPADEAPAEGTASPTAEPGALDALRTALAAASVPHGRRPDADAPKPPRANPLHTAAQDPAHQDFYLLMRRLEAWYADKPRFGTARRPVDEPVRLAQATDLGFAIAPVHEVQAHDPRSGKPRLVVNFFGLFGPNGPLPLHLTAHARERRLHKGDVTFERFADLFHHRLLLLFYRAWSQGQPTASLDRPGEDRFADMVGALAGVGGAEWRARDGAPDHVRLAFAGVLSRQVRNADGLGQLLGGLLNAPVRVEQFVGRWMPLPPDERTRIGRRGASRRQSTNQLGRSAVLGQAVYDRQHHIRIHVGPLRPAELEALLPGGAQLAALSALLLHYLGLEIGWDLQLTLAPGEVPPTRPGRSGRLGWTTWLGQRPPQAPAASVRLNPSPVPA